jgi:hypothetical protein
LYVFKQHIQKFAGSDVLLATVQSQAMISYWGAYYFLNFCYDFHEALSLFPDPSQQPDFDDDLSDD